MADSCTYADLRFEKGSPTLRGHQDPRPPTEHYPAGSGAVYAESTYANVTGSGGGVSGERAPGGPRRTEPESPPEGKSWNKHLVAILAVLSLVSLATCTGLGVQLFQISKDRGTQKRNYLQSIQTQTEKLEDTENRLKDTEIKLTLAKKELENSQKTMEHINVSFHSTLKTLGDKKEQLSESQQNATETQSRLSSVERRLNGIMDFLADYEDAEYCQKGWTLLVGSCLSFSEHKLIRSQSQSQCESKDAWLVGSRISDPAVKKYMENKLTDEFWVGLRSQRWHDFNWIEPNDSVQSSTYYICAITVKGQLKHSSCYYDEQKYQYICERNPMKIKIKNGVPIQSLYGPEEA